MKGRRYYKYAYWLKKAPRITKAQKVLAMELTKRGIANKVEHRVKAKNGKIYHFDIYIPPDIDIEVDGASHSRPSRVKKDKERDGVLKEMGYKIIRVPEYLVFKRLEDVIYCITRGMEVNCGTCSYNENGYCAVAEYPITVYEVCKYWEVSR